ncbi:putative transferase CAF17 homolog, mitochondrial [Tetranychus urticae]|uniref:CAF17 C-terminal domain-containing protein n=1 Tax=Tetranychus urticae TaxID=32264 RepID=T1KRG1_TETUR|nr:putative transferase CAF17 homolog, mitochondrial [Tetranychus urticae]
MVHNFLKLFKFHSFVLRRSHSFKAVNLTNKKLILVRGEHCYRFLQGLITNDVRHLYPNQTTSVHLSCIYTLFLHPNGRVFLDAFIYDNHVGKNDGDNSNENLQEESEDSSEPKIASADEQLLIEVDNSISDKLFRHLKLHKLKSKVNINYPDDRYNVWSLYPGEMVDDQAIFPKIDHSKSSNCLITVDPRIKNHYRCLIDKNCDKKEILTQLEKKYNFPFIESTIEDYTKYRYESGIGEGATDHPDGNCLPHECNGDFLHGISFHKGCYIGQELTARVHHTGVVRKRLLPIRLINTDSQENLQNHANCDIVSKNDGARLGKLRAGRGHLGLGLMYVENTILKGQTTGYIKTSDNLIKVETFKPFWWPNEVKLFNK